MPYLVIPIFLSAFANGWQFLKNRDLNSKIKLAEERLAELKKIEKEDK